MKTIKTNENWTITRENLKQRFISLTDNDLKFKEDNIEEMLGELRIKLGKTKEEMNKTISTP